MRLIVEGFKIGTLAVIVLIVLCKFASCAEYTIYIENEELINNHMDLPGFDGMLWEDAGDKKGVQW